MVTTAPVFPVALTDASKVLLWAEESTIEAAALDQLRAAENHPDVVAARVMPDVHYGKGFTVGSVIAMRDAVAPAAVGVDIGCGVAAVQTSLREEHLKDLPALRSAIEAAIPVGFNAHPEPVFGSSYNALGVMEGFDGLTVHEQVADRENKVALQLGTLGGGNHFCELTADEGGAVWLTLHSGSRNIGKTIADIHISRAKGLEHNAAYGDMAVFRGGTAEMDAYLHDLTWAQSYAAASRGVMMGLFRKVLADHFLARGRLVNYGITLNCLAGETGVTTADGVLPIRDLAGGTHTLLTEGGQWVQAPVQSFGQQKLYEIVIGRYGQAKTIRATAGHRWLLRPKVAHNRTEAITTELRVGDRLAYVFPARVPFTPSQEGIQRGFIFGDGTQRGKQATAIFCGEKDSHLLPYFEGSRLPLRWYTQEHDDGRSVTQGRINGFPAEWKFSVPADDAPAEEIAGWLAGYFAADGDVGKTGRPTICSANREHLEAFKRLAGKLGIVTHAIRERVSNEGAYRGAGQVSYLLGLSRDTLEPEFFLIPEHRTRFAANQTAVTRNGWTVRSVRETEAIEEVFCAVVEGTHSFALEDNILTGNCHHNYVDTETIDGEELVVTRKGAIAARAGDLALIPGSMGTGSYIVQGLGNPASLYSASHGAGRVMSRTKAKKQFTAADLAAQTAGIECRKDAGVVDEIPAAYKDVHSVIGAQAELVRPVAHLRTLLCVKG